MIRWIVKPNSIQSSGCYIVGHRSILPEMDRFATLCRNHSSLANDFWWTDYQNSHGSKIESLPEQIAVVQFEQFLKKCSETGSCPPDRWISTNSKPSYQYEMTPNELRIALDSAMATFNLHVQARIASLVGVGYYTIGPCGEELLSSAGLALEREDSTALHYRHSGILLARQLQDAQSSSQSQDSSFFQDLLLDRARGYTVSKLDPVTGGVHCAIGEGAGGNVNNFVVTSTLASQCPPAVGRALGYGLVERLKQNNPIGARPISFCTVGDGSVHHGHFWSALTLARHSQHRNIKCPLVMGISNNGYSISYATKNTLQSLFPDDSGKQQQQLKIVRANGQDCMDVYDKTKQAALYARRNSVPVILIYDNIVRRFGHAATDRQHAYLEPERIQRHADSDVLSSAILQAVEGYSILSYSEIRDRWNEIQQMTNHAFAIATNESKVTLDDMMARVAAPLSPVVDNVAERTMSQKTSTTSTKYCKDMPQSSHHKTNEKPQVMRKNMTRVLAEVLSDDKSVVYLGEDVEHGGYYLVTDRLAQQFPGRVIDFPPDETSLLGAALGFSQLGLVPIVEIPYAKYLDCGVDMFYEIGLYHWLTNASDNTGMVIRLQGFDRGLFGGNFHTHNMLSHVPPGVDVVCFSNGHDYVTGFRHAIHQAKAGRVVVSVDCTHLLNLRHIHEDQKDRGWEFVYPSIESHERFLAFDEIRRYQQNNGSDTTNCAKIALVSFGNGVVTSLQARQALVDRGVVRSKADIDILDCPYLSGVPKGLEEVLPQYDKVVFADICKEGPGSNVLSSMIVTLQQKELLPSAWAFVGAPRTYNPLGSYVTFLNSERIEKAVEGLIDT